MSDTPRTDANLGKHLTRTGFPVVDPVFARQLELELNAANERIKRLEEESESRWHLAQSAIGSCAEMSSRIKRLEEAGDVMAKLIPFAIGDDEDESWANHMMSYNKARCRGVVENWTKAKGRL